MKILNQRIDALLAESRHLDVSIEEIIALVQDRGRNLQSKEEK
jgi:hypothetical protein